MATSTVDDYFLQVVKVTQHYLGPAAERFIRRQIEFHLQKPPETLTKTDISKLTSNVSIALGLLVDDKRIVEEAVSELNHIT